MQYEAYVVDADSLTPGTFEGISSDTAWHFAARIDVTPLLGGAWGLGVYISHIEFYHPSPT